MKKGLFILAILAGFGCDRSLETEVTSVSKNLLAIESSLCEADKACRADENGSDTACTLPEGSPFAACASENEAFMKCILENGECLTDAAGSYFDLSQENAACDAIEDAMFACENTKLGN